MVGTLKLDVPMLEILEPAPKPSAALRLKAFRLNALALGPRVPMLRVQKPKAKPLKTPLLAIYPLPVRNSTTLQPSVQHPAPQVPRLVALRLRAPRVDAPRVDVLRVDVLRVDALKELLDAACASRHVWRKSESMTTGVCMNEWR